MQRVKRLPFSQEDDRIILEKIKRNPHNLQQCFRELSVELNRNKDSIQTHWYKTLSKRVTNNKSGAFFTLVGPYSHSVNRKIVREDTSPAAKNWKYLRDRVLKLLNLV